MTVASRFNESISSFKVETFELMAQPNTTPTPSTPHARASIILPLSTTHSPQSVDTYIGEHPSAAKSIESVAQHHLAHHFDSSPRALINTFGLLSSQDWEINPQPHDDWRPDSTLLHRRLAHFLPLGTETLYATILTLC